LPFWIFCSASDFAIQDLSHFNGAPLAFLSVSKLEFSPAAENLRLQLTDSALLKFVKKHPHLRHFDLARTNVTSDGIIAAINEVKITHLKHLTMPNMQRLMRLYASPSRTFELTLESLTIVHFGSSDHRSGKSKTLLLDAFGKTLKKLDLTFIRPPYRASSLYQFLHPNFFSHYCGYLESLTTLNLSGAAEATQLHFIPMMLAAAPNVTTAHFRVVQERQGDRLVPYDKTSIASDAPTYAAIIAAKSQLKSITLTFVFVDDEIIGPCATILHAISKAPKVEYLSFSALSLHDVHQGPTRIPAALKSALPGFHSLRNLSLRLFKDGSRSLDIVEKASPHIESLTVHDAVSMSARNSFIERNPKIKLKCSVIPDVSSRFAELSTVAPVLPKSVPTECEACSASVHSDDFFVRAIFST
jgi:hypothetical protein